MRYPLVIFDFDGTLADSFPWFLSVFNEVAEEFRFRKIEIGKADELRGMSTRALLSHLKIPFWKLSRVARRMRSLASRDRAAIPLFAETSGLLRGLQGRGVVLAIVSSNSEENVRAILGAENAGLISHFVCNASLFGKSSLLKKALRAARVKPAQALYVGDETRDIEAARKAGVASGAVAWGYANPLSLRALQPEHFFKTPADLLAELES